ncbi:MFS transporter [Clostridium isatidis]|uniref:MFS transporter n=1 Tax=Clostridium isatidis TaxID=182773 RepID=A0A343JF45_9CLOT|nr:MFS transporter [Clostridium isatidis]ASW44153.1 MFS transporter [Clostridium isatidis]
MNNNWKKNIILFLTTQTISLLGSSLVQYAIMWYITLETQSGTAMTISIICGFLPTLFLSPFGGVWADRYDRKKLIAISDSFIAISTLILAILFLRGYDSIWLLYLTSSIRALGSAIQTPAINALIPQIVPEDKLTKVNASNGSIQSLVMLISPMLSGALLTMTTIEVIFFIDVITAAIAVSILVFFLHVPVHEKALKKQENSYFGDMKEGLEYIKNHKFLKEYFVFCAFFFILAAPVSFLTPLQVTRNFGNDVWRLTAIEITFSVGMMLGGGIMAAWGGFKNRVYTMAFSTLIMALCTIALGIVPSFWVYISLFGLFGMVMPMFNTPSTVLIQEKVEEEFLGRVFSVLSMITSVMMPLGMLVFGPMADYVAIEKMLIVTGILIFIEGLIMRGSKVLIKAGEEKELTTDN